MSLRRFLRLAPKLLAGVFLFAAMATAWLAGVDHDRDTVQQRPAALLPRSLATTP